MYKILRQRLTALISNDIQIEQLLVYIEMPVGQGLLFRTMSILYDRSNFGK